MPTQHGMKLHYIWMLATTDITRGLGIGGERQLHTLVILFPDKEPSVPTG